MRDSIETITQCQSFMEEEVQLDSIKTTITVQLNKEDQRINLADRERVHLPRKSQHQKQEMANSSHILKKNSIENSSKN